MQRALNITIWIVAAAICHNPAGAEEPTHRLYHQALTADKMTGDGQRAITLYREVLKRYQAGKAAPELAARARQRLLRLGVAETTLPLAIRQPLPLQGLRERFGFETSDGVSPVAPADLFAPGRVRTFALGHPHGRDRDSRSAGTSQHPGALGAVERQLRAVRYALGITGLLEYLEAVAAARRRPRPQSAHELYLAGLHATTELAAPDEARVKYELALKSAAPALENRIQRRLSLLSAGIPQTTNP